MIRLGRVWRFALPLLLTIIMSGCGDDSPSSGPIFFEFKQQPGDKYVYKIRDEVDWEIKYRSGESQAFRQLQEQNSIMKFTNIDSNAVRSLSLSFIVTLDSVLDITSNFPMKEKSLVGKRFDYDMDMRPNGEIITVESEDPAVIFYFNSAYRPSQPVFPKGAITTGYSWSQSATVAVPHGPPATVNSEYTFRNIERIGEFDCAVIDFAGKIEYTEKPNKKDDQKENQETFHCRTQNKGQLYFAFREGFVVKKVNTITSDAKCIIGDKENGIVKSNTQVIDYENITLTDIYRSNGEKFTLRVE